MRRDGTVIKMVANYIWFFKTVTIGWVLMILLFFMMKGAAVGAIFPTTIVFAFVLLSFIGMEEYEYKHGGYRFVSQLPVRLRKIAYSKYLAVFIVNVLSYAFLITLAVLSDAAPETVETSSAIALIMFGITLLTIGVIFPFIYRDGYGRYKTVLKAALMLEIIVPQFVIVFRIERTFRLSDVGFMKIFAWPYAIPVMATMCVIYFGLMILAGKEIEIHEKI